MTSSVSPAEWRIARDLASNAWAASFPTGYGVGVGVEVENDFDRLQPASQSSVVLIIERPGEHRFRQLDVTGD